MMEELREFAGNLQAEVLLVRDDYRKGLITDQAALGRITLIRHRAKAGRDGFMTEYRKEATCTNAPARCV